MTNQTHTQTAAMAEIRRGLQLYCQQGAVYEVRALGTGNEGGESSSGITKTSTKWPVMPRH